MHNALRAVLSKCAEKHTREAQKVDDVDDTHTHTHGRAISIKCRILINNAGDECARFYWAQWARLMSRTNDCVHLSTNNMYNVQCTGKNARDITFTSDAHSHSRTHAYTLTFVFDRMP